MPTPVHLFCMTYRCTVVGEMFSWEAKNKILMPLILNAFMPLEQWSQCCEPGSDLKAEIHLNSIAVPLPASSILTQNWPETISKILHMLKWYLGLLSSISMPTGL